MPGSQRGFENQAGSGTGFMHFVCIIPLLTLVGLPMGIRKDQVWYLGGSGANI